MPALFCKSRSFHRYDQKLGPLSLIRQLGLRRDLLIGWASFLDMPDLETLPDEEVEHHPHV